MISVLVADDHGVVREGIRRVLEGEPDVRVCGEAANGEEVLAMVEEHLPDVVLLDISMPKLSGLEALERMRKLHPEIKTVLLSFRAEPPVVQSAIALGADGYLLKNARKDEILTAIREAVQGGSYFSPAVAREIAERVRDGGRGAEEPFTQLSGRERELIALVVSLENHCHY